MSISRMDRPSNVPGASGSICGCEGGAEAIGNEVGSTPSDGFRSGCPAGAGVEGDGCEPTGVDGCTVGFAALPRSRGVYSVVSDGAGAWGAEIGVSTRG